MISLYWRGDDYEKALERYEIRLKEPANTVIFNDKEDIQYKGSLKVLYSKLVQKKHFKLTVT